MTMQYIRVDGNVLALPLEVTLTENSAKALWGKNNYIYKDIPEGYPLYQLILDSNGYIIPDSDKVAASVQRDKELVAWKDARTDWIKNGTMLNDSRYKRCVKDSCQEHMEQEDWDQILEDYPSGL